MAGALALYGHSTTMLHLLLMNRATANLLLSLANGYILYFFSERLFWTVWRTGDSVAEQVITWLAYCAATYLFLCVVTYFRCNDFASVCLAGAFYGWLIEGTLAPTLYGTEDSAPFPLSLCITSLSWHMLISVALGWYALAKALNARRCGCVGLAIGVGVFWGAWATFQWRESPPVVVSLRSLPATRSRSSFLIAAWWLNLHVDLQRFHPGRPGLFFGVLVVATFYAQHIAKMGLRPLVILPAVLALALFPLWRRRQRFPSNAAVVVRPRGRLFLLLLTPAAALTIYVVAMTGEWDELPISSILFYWTTAPLGVAVALWSFVTTMLKQPTPKTESTEFRL
jgi:hypothetical protein